MPFMVSYLILKIILLTYIVVPHSYNKNFYLLTILFISKMFHFTWHYIYIFPILKFDLLFCSLIKLKVLYKYIIYCITLLINRWFLFKIIFTHWDEIIYWKFFFVEISDHINVFTIYNNLLAPMGVLPKGTYKHINKFKHEFLLLSISTF